MDAEQQLAAVQAAERLGYDSVWTAEAYGSDAATILAWIAGRDHANQARGGDLPDARLDHRAMTAMTAATIDRLSGGRMILGLGSSGPQVAEGWHGQRFAGQLQRTREYFEVVRMALRRERLEYHGEMIELPLPDGPGRALKLTIAPVQERIPIYLAAIGPRNTALAGEIADGWIPTFFCARADRALPQAAPGGSGARPALAGRLRHRPTGERPHQRRPRSRAKPDAAGYRSLRRRDGFARAELLQDAGLAIRLRRCRAGDPGSVSGGSQRRGLPRGARRADRPGVAVRPGGRRKRPACRRIATPASEP